MAFSTSLRMFPNQLLKAAISERIARQPFWTCIANYGMGPKPSRVIFGPLTTQSNSGGSEHIDYTNIFDESGAPLYAYAVGRDITASKIAENGGLDEVAYAQATQSANLLAKVRSNLTQDYVESYSAQEGIA
ncbi:MAG: hypothetical protein ACRC2O_18590, partial [Chitinophagaceae bacterium]